MKPQRFIVLLVALALALAFGGMALSQVDECPYTPTTTLNICPIKIEQCTGNPPPQGCFKEGDAASECLQAGECWEWAYKVDNPANNGTYLGPPNVGDPPVGTVEITIENSDGITFDWKIQSGWAVCKVLVKAGTAVYVYSYDGATGDTGLTAPNGKQISHVTFCYAQSGTNVCYKPETAWAANSDKDCCTLLYNTKGKGNWATYVEFKAGDQDKTVNVYAGQTYLAGTATFHQNGGNVEITINLYPGFYFYYDLIDPLYDNNLKVQGYTMQPSGNPAPGLFDNKKHIDVGETTGFISVPLNSYKYFGVQLEVVREYECPPTQ